MSNAWVPYFKYIDEEKEELIPDNLRHFLIEVNATGIEAGRTKGDTTTVVFAVVGEVNVTFTIRDETPDLVNVNAEVYATYGVDYLRTLRLNVIPLLENAEIDGLLHTLVDLNSENEYYLIKTKFLDK
jgi:hypothetical protein